MIGNYRIMKIKSLTIYCSSSEKLDQKFYILTKKIGVFLAQNDITIVYGGGNIGLMGKLSNAALKTGGKVIGVIPEFLKKGENINLNNSKTIVVKTMSQRKKILFEKGDAFLILPGGSGTIEEATEIISWKFLGIHKKNIIIFNFDNYWLPLMDMYKKAEENNFGNKFLNTNLQSICDNINSFEEFVSLFSQ